MFLENSPKFFLGHRKKTLIMPKRVVGIKADGIKHEILI